MICVLESNYFIFESLRSADCKLGNTPLDSIPVNSECN
jgi:hypothetical protein